MKFYEVPGFPKILCNELGEFFQTNLKPRSKTYKDSKQGSRAKLNTYRNDGSRATVSVARLVLMAKLERTLEPWEEACHIDGNPTNDSMNNLEAKSRLRNIIDEYKLSRLPKLPNDEIDKAIAELQALKSDKNL